MATSPAVPLARPGGPPDTSAAAIEAVAALKLAARASATCPQTAARLRERATAVLRELVTAHLRDGRLLNGCYDIDHGVATRHELVWGDFFLAVGLATLTGVISPFTC